MKDLKDTLMLNVSVYFIFLFLGSVLVYKYVNKTCELFQDLNCFPFAKGERLGMKHQEPFINT